jgi:MbtH protein
VEEGDILDRRRPSDAAIVQLAIGFGKGGGKRMRGTEEDTTVYSVVVNHEVQYAIWPAARERPPGWRDPSKQGTREECLAHIGEVWTDMRPLSLRKAMEETGREP